MSNYYFSNRSNVFIEAGIDRHWDAIEQETLPLIFRTLNFKFKQKDDSKQLSLNDLNSTFYLFIIGMNVSLVSIFIELFHNNYIKSNRL